MFAFVAVVLFLASPFWSHLGPWPLVTSRALAALALHLMLGLGLPWRRGQG